MKEGQGMGRVSSPVACFTSMNEGQGMGRCTGTLLVMHRLGLSLKISWSLYSGGIGGEDITSHGAAFGCRTKQYVEQVACDVVTPSWVSRLMVVGVDE